MESQSDTVVIMFVIDNSTKPPANNNIAIILSLSAGEYRDIKKAPNMSDTTPIITSTLNVLFISPPSMWNVNDLLS